MKHVTIYTDGACRGNPGPGGWAALLRYGQHEKIISGAETITTNNRMEMMAAISALAILQESCQIDIFTDSRYLQKGVSEWLINWKANNWKKADKKKIKNMDLWQTLDEAVNKHKISWHWVAGHSGHVENDLVDKIANEAIDNLVNKG